MDALTTYFNIVLHDIGGFEVRPHCAVAVSGGVDSMALVLLMRAWLACRDGQLTALIVDHGLRPESAQEARGVAMTLGDLGIASEVLTLTFPNGITSIQRDAREARYHVLEAWCQRHHVLHMLTAHHGDDQLETLMMRFIRGSGVQGLCAIDKVRYLSQVRLVRPLLEVSKQACIDYVKARGVRWVEDPTNSKPLYLRNRVRGWLPHLQEEGLDVARGLTLVDNFRRSNHFIHHTLVKWMVKHVLVSPAGYVRVAAQALQQLDDELLYRIIKSVCCVVLGVEDVARLEEIERLARALKYPEKFKPRTLNGCLVLVDKLADNVFFIRELERIADACCVSHSYCPKRWDNRFEVTGQFFCEKTYYIGALGVRGVGFLRKLNYALPKLPVQVLRVFPAVFYDTRLEELACVPHMGYYSDAPLYNDLRITWSPMKALAD